MKSFFLAALYLFLSLSLALAPTAYAQEASISSNYKIQSDSINFAGDHSDSATYGLEDTAGELASGSSTSAGYTALQGYQFMQLDIIPPTAPPSISATPLSSQEIEVSWGAATDDFGVDRYDIYRDGVRVANVQNFPRDFIDSGLHSNQVFLYNVSAVDAAGNEGPWSATTSAKTFLPPLPTGSPSPQISGLTVTNWSVTANDTNAIVGFHTSAVLKAEIFWGRDKNYTDGHLGHGFGDGHTFLLEHLVPDTLYYVKILLLDGYGRQNFYYLTFRTSMVPLAGQPANVTDFSAVRNTSSATSTVDLSWKLPSDPRVVGVRVVRGTSFYPSSPKEGKVIFENRDASGMQTFSDADVTADSPYYYAIFTEDLAGNFSSGVLAEVGGNPLDNLVAAGTVDAKIGKLALKDFLFIQSGDSMPVQDDLVSVVGNQNLTVALRAYHLPPVLKTIAVSMVTADYKRFTFILRPNADGTRYEATVASLGDPTVYKMHLDVLDYANHGLKSLKGTLAVRAGEVVAYIIDPKARKFFGFGLLAVALVGAYAWVSRRKFKELKIIRDEPWTVLAQKLSNNVKN